MVLGVFFSSKIKDATPAIFVVIMLFIVPADWNCLAFFHKGGGKFAYKSCVQ